MPSPAVRPWQQALRPEAIFFRLSEALDSCAAAISPQEDQQQRRVWAVDLACGKSTGPAPKFFVVATPAVFVDTYLACTKPNDRHAYEVVESTRGCFLYFDLEQCFTSAAQLAQSQEAGQCVAATAAVVLAELAALREPGALSPLRINVLMLDATRPIEGELAGKYSAHLVCRMWRDGVPWLLRGPADAGAVARRVSERLLEEGHTHAAALIDLAVYGDRRPFRLLGSTKLTDARSRPLQLLDGGGAPLSAADVLASLVAPALQPQTLPPFAIPSAAQSSRPRMRPAPDLTRHAKAPRRDGAVAHGRWWPRHTEMPLLHTPVPTGSRRTQAARSAAAAGDAVAAGATAGTVAVPETCYAPLPHVRRWRAAGGRQQPRWAAVAARRLMEVPLRKPRVGTRARLASATPFASSFAHRPQVTAAWPQRRQALQPPQPPQSHGLDKAPR